MNMTVLFLNITNYVLNINGCLLITPLIVFDEIGCFLNITEFV
jgi:hypothetical protein